MLISNFLDICKCKCVCESVLGFYVCVCLVCLVLCVFVCVCMCMCVLEYLILCVCVFVCLILCVCVCVCLWWPFQCHFDSMFNMYARHWLLRYNNSLRSQNRLCSIHCLFIIAESFFKLSWFSPKQYFVIAKSLRLRIILQTFS